MSEASCAIIAHAFSNDRTHCAAKMTMRGIIECMIGILCSNTATLEFRQS
jgi:hypothetical protein